MACILNRSFFLELVGKNGETGRFGIVEGEFHIRAIFRNLDACSKTSKFKQFLFLHFRW